MKDEVLVKRGGREEWEKSDECREGDGEKE
jgi:hypothetical protein